MKINDLFESYFIRSGPAKRYPGIKTRIVSENEAERILYQVKRTVDPRIRSTFKYGNDQYLSILSETDKRIIKAFDSFKLPPSATGDYEFDQLVRQLRQHIDEEVGRWIQSKIGGDFVSKALSLRGNPTTVDDVLSSDYPEHKKLEFMYVTAADKLRSFLNTLESNINTVYHTVKNGRDR